ncbi:hypothetical protein [Actinomadura rubrisoli]|uniref:Uncharacterized protein n=1 Tax=Actinomadura rubrisoli TaxID=2530368 RepID=A0A4R5BRL2_9ACTN|nr:hypothetical protein [Actinomadura rubrisoli]TDD88186.1 hypothetical protein E1298_15390 [Actinomadura rubrisoli]
MGNPLPPEAGRGLFALFDWMTGRLPLRLDTRPFPVTVLEPASGQDAPDQHLDVLKSLASEMGLSVISPEAAGAPDGEAAAIALVDAISQPLTWSGTSSHFGRLRFPRSDLVRTIQAAAVLAGVLLLVAGLSARPVWLPVLSRIGFGGRYRWFARTSFFAVLGDGDDLGFERRLHRVSERLTKPDAARFLLQIKTFALLEDIRDQHRRLAPSLRGFKRPAPPVVFLPRVSRRGGGLAVLSAMSDIRTRRSEFHPLLVIATLDADTRDDWLGGPAPGTGAPKARYDYWRSSLGIAQGPSESVPLPWLLRIPVGGDPAADDRPGLAVRRRPRWTWLWSWRGLIAGALVCAIVLTFAQTHLRATYCSVGLPFGWNGDTRQQTNADGSRECVGVSTHGVRFERGADSIGLDGDLRRPSTANTGGHITLADLQRKIDEENRRVVREGEPYATMVYAGIFTASAGQSELTVSSIRDLAGAYLAQIRNNHRGNPGEIGNSLKLRILPANAGQDMALSVETADRILHLARHDPSIVGVAGFGRNTGPSRTAIERLTGAGLPVVNTVNSSDQLPGVDHYYRLAATNYEEAAASRAALRDAGVKGPIKHAMLVHRSSGPSKDVYSSEIANDVKRVLAPSVTDRVTYVGTGDISSKVKAACEKPGAPYTLVYFAGRAEDLPGLMNGLVQGGCTRNRLVLLAGDDVTRSRFGTGPHEVRLPQNTTVYHTAFVHLPNLIANNADLTDDFFLMARGRLAIGVPRVRPAEPLLVDGQMALTFDATIALSEAAQNAYNFLGRRLVTGGRSVTAGAVLEELRILRVKRGGSATGNIDFTGDHREPVRPVSRGLTVVKVTLKDGRPQSTPICGRLNGGAEAPGLKPC